jgi:hypothetical protein
MSNPEVIEVGDRVVVGFNDGSSVTGEVLYVPGATGDSWRIRNQKGHLVYLQVFAVMRLVEKKEQGA